MRTDRGYSAYVLASKQLHTLFSPAPMITGLPAFAGNDTLG